jgi:hypothetical protein
MKVYLAKFTYNNKIAYKIGHTKFYYPKKRFEDEEYSIFSNIEILADINVQDPDAKSARLMSTAIEFTLQALYPKNFRLEEYFETENNSFDGLSGITEMFILESFDEEQKIVDIFKKVNALLGKKRAMSARRQE